MNPLRRSLRPSQAATQLGVSAKALRLYETRGLISPGRTAAGWRTYDQADLARAAEVIALRAIGLTLAQIGRILEGHPSDLGAILSAHEARLRGQSRQITAALENVRVLRSGILQEQAPHPGKSVDARDERARLAVGFALPWPWGGEWFEIRDVGLLTFITGPLGSGKTRFAQRLAETLPGAAFLGLDRSTDARIPLGLAEDATLAERVESSLKWLAAGGARRSDALIALITALEADRPSILVIDMVEHGLDEAAQAALMAYMRGRAPRKRALFLMTRSSSILNMDAVGATEKVIMCPANHSPPICVVPYPGERGYEAVATCLAPPDVRARTAGTVAMHPHAA